MNVVALRGVCIGPGRHLAVGDRAEVDPATAQFLTSIGAVKEFIPAVEPESVSTTAKSVKKER